jgi:hypothetical protein
MVGMNYSVEGEYFINGQDAYLKYGLVFKGDLATRTGIFKEVLKTPAKKMPISKSWSDQHGTQRLFPATPFFESIDYNIPLYHVGNGFDDFYTKYELFRDFLQTTPGYFDLDVVGLNRRFKLVYVNMPSFEKLTLFREGEMVVCESVVSLINDFPVNREILFGFEVDDEMDLYSTVPDSFPFTFQLDDSGHLLMITG